METKTEKIWFNAQLSSNKMNEFKEKYPDYDLDMFLEIARTGTYDDFCGLCQIVRGNSYLKSALYKIEYEDSKTLKKALNTRTNELMGEKLTALFDVLRISQKHEYWGGDNRYQLFSYDFGEYSDRQVIKSAVRLLTTYIGKPLEVEDISEVSSLYTSGLFWDLYPELELDYDWGIETDWEIVNSNREKNLNAWLMFMRHIANNEFGKANELINKYQKIDEELCAKQKKVV